jgi:hypothetical protein
MMQPTVPIEPIRHRAAWKASELGSKEELAIDLAPRHLDAIEHALREARAQGHSVATLRRDCFPLASIAGDIAAWRHELTEGSGLLLLRGFPIERYSVEDWELIFLGLGAHFGEPVSQSNLGDRVGHVINVGGQDRRERAYRNNRELTLHTDRCDYIGMLCLQKAKQGGVSSYASALTVHNEIAASRPELLEPLYAGYRLHRFGEQPAGEPVVTDTRIPVFSIADGCPNVIYIRGYIELAVQEGFYSLDELEREALDYFDEIANRPDVRLDLMLEPGEATFTNNCVLLHRRSAFEDHEDPRRRRHLLRLWLVDRGRPATAAVRLHKTERGIEKQEGRGTYYRGPGYQTPEDDKRY